MGVVDERLRRQQQRCQREIETVNSTGHEGGCPRIWDGILCWPPEPPGQLAKQSCPTYMIGFDPQKEASKLCTLQGDWFINPDTNRTWTNFTQCSNRTMTRVVVRFPDTDNTTIIAQYVPVIKAVSRAGYAVSLVTLIVAFCILASFKKLRCPRNKLHMHLFVSFMLRAFLTLLKDVLFVRGLGLPSDIAFLDGQAYFLDNNEESWKCKLIMSLWQYCIMGNYCWILMEGIYLHNLIFLAVFSDTSAISAYVVLGWGLPLLFVVPWAVVRALWEDTLCWTQNTNPVYFLIIKVPITLTILVNFVLFLNIVRLLLTKLMAAVSEENKALRYRRWAKSTLVLVPLFGVHYIVFLVMSYVGVPIRVELIWLFIDQLFTSFQGFLVAILYCLLNGEVRLEVSRHWRRRSLCRGRHSGLSLNALPQPSTGPRSYLGAVFNRRRRRHSDNARSVKEDMCGSTVMTSVANDVNSSMCLDCLPPHI